MSIHTTRSNSAFAQTNAYGNSVEEEVSTALTEAGFKHESIPGDSPLQTYGDIQVKLKKRIVYVEVKGNRNYNDRTKRYNLYFELFEGYGESYNNTDKRRTIDLVGILNQLAFRKTTIFVHKLGTTNAYLVYSPQNMFEYLAADLKDSWQRDFILSEDADGQKGKFKLGARIKHMRPDSLRDDYRASRLQDYATLTTRAHLAKAIAREAKRAPGHSLDAASAYRHLIRKRAPGLTKSDWWYFMPSLRKKEPRDFKFSRGSTDSSR